MACLLARWRPVRDYFLLSVIDPGPWELLDGCSVCLEGEAGVGLGVCRSKRGIMRLSRSICKVVPGCRRSLKDLHDLLRGLPRVSYGSITKELIRHYVARPDPTIIEVGCNDGENTLWFLEVFESAKVHCFEPDPRAVARFKRNVGERPNVDLLQVAVGDHVGQVPFYQSSGQRNKEEIEDMPEGWDRSGSIRRPKDHRAVYPWVTFEHAITVSMETLDAWCDKAGVQVVDFLWMDVQGAELDVLKGAGRTLGSTRFLYTEYGDRELYEGQAHLKELLRHLKQWEVLIRYPCDVLLANREWAR